MATLKGPGAMKQLPLVAIWKDSQVVRDGKGNVTGAYLDVQLDQTGLSEEDIRAGKGDTNPHIETHSATAKDGTKIRSHTVWYSKAQMDTMSKAGYSVRDHEKGVNAVAFTANVTRVENARTGDKRMIVLLPKDPEKAKTPEERAKIERYNQANSISHPKEGWFDEGALEWQEHATAAVRAEAHAKFERKQEAARNIEQVASASVDGIKDKSYIAVWKDGSTSVDLQRDYSLMDGRDVRNRSADPNPHVYNHHDGVNFGGIGAGYVTHNVEYTNEQLQAMQAVGTTIELKDGMVACSFTGPADKDGRLDIPRDLDGATAQLGPSSNPNFSLSAYENHMDIVREAGEHAAGIRASMADKAKDTTPISDYAVMWTGTRRADQDKAFGKEPAPSDVEAAIRGMIDKNGSLPMVSPMELYGSDAELAEGMAVHDGMVLLDNVRHEMHVTVGTDCRSTVDAFLKNEYTRGDDSPSLGICWYDSLERQKASERRFDLEEQDDFDEDAPSFD